MKMINQSFRPTSEEGVGLYVHIPFCVRKCTYCDFLSFGVAESADFTEKATVYAEALCREIRTRLQQVSQPVRTVYFGGGTPSVLPVTLIQKIARTIYSSAKVQPDAEWTIECNPATFDQAKALEWRNMGFNRVSMGVQSLNDRLLQRIGRVHTADQARQGYQMLRAAGFTNISVDLMMGLPEQSLEDYLESLEEVISWNPEHVSCYSLILEEGTPLYEEEDLPLPDEDTERKMYHETIRKLRNAGLLQYEISNFAKPGFESRHNSSYWQRIPYLGCGLGASSFLYEKRYRNATSLALYLQGSEPVLEETLDPHAQMQETMLLGLRMLSGVSEKEFEQKFKLAIDDVFGEEIRTLREEGLLQRINGRISLTTKGLDLANQVFMMFV